MSYLSSTEQRHLRLFVHALAYNRPPEWKLEKHDGWYSVSGERLRPFVHHKNHSICRDRLEQAGFVETRRTQHGTPSYQAGKNGISYRLKAPIRHVNADSGDTRLRKKLEDGPAQLQELCRKYISAQRRPFFDVIVSPRLTFDVSEARRLVQKRHEGNESNIAEALHRIEELSRPRWRRASECDYGRLHSAITWIEKQVRWLLKWDGCPLYEVDVKCSQPTLVQALGPVDALWKELISGSDLYEFIADKLELPKNDPNRRTIAKYHPSKKEEALIDGQCLGLIPWLYAPVGQNETKRQRIAGIVRGCFPKVFELVTTLKRHDYRQLARELQKRESEIVIDDVASILITGNPQSCIITIHDGILCDSEELAKDAQARLHKSLANNRSAGQVEYQYLPDTLHAWTGL